MWQRLPLIPLPLDSSLPPGFISPNESHQLAISAAVTSQQTVTIGGVAWEAVFSADASYVRSRVSGAPRTLMIVVALFALSVLVGA